MNRNKVLLLSLVTLLAYFSARAQEKWSLQACVDTAYERNISLNQGRVTTIIDKFTLKQSKAQLYPSANINESLDLTFGKSFDPAKNQYNTYTSSIDRLGLNSSVTLFNGYLLINTIKQNRLFYESGNLDVETTRNNILLSVLASYMQVLMDYEAIDVAQAQIDATNIQVEETKKFVEFGKVAELNLLQIESQLAADKLTKVTAENQADVDKVTLLQLMQVPYQANFDIERMELKELFPEIPISPEAIDQISESFLPEIKSASLKTNASIFGLKMSKSGWYPRLSFGMGLTTGYSSFADIQLSNQLKKNFGQYLNFTLAIPIFNNSQVRYKVAISKENVTNAQLNEKLTKNNLRQSIETAYTNQVTAGKKLVSVEEQMKLEQRTYSDMAEKYSVGAADVTDFLIEKNNFNRVSMSLIQAKYDYVLKAKIVDFYLGKPVINK